MGCLIAGFRNTTQCSLDKRAFLKKNLTKIIPFVHFTTKSLIDQKGSQWLSFVHLVSFEPIQNKLLEHCHKAKKLTKGNATIEQLQDMF